MLSFVFLIPQISNLVRDGRLDSKASKTQAEPDDAKVNRFAAVFLGFIINDQYFSAIKLRKFSFGGFSLIIFKLQLGTLYKPTSGVKRSAEESNEI